MHLWLSLYEALNQAVMLVQHAAIAIVVNFSESFMIGVGDIQNQPNLTIVFRINANREAVFKAGRVHTLTGSN